MALLNLRILIVLALMLTSLHQELNAQSVARVWNETQLAGIRLSFARPTVHALHLKRMGIAMYDAWAAYDDVATPYMLGQTHGNFTSEYNGIPAVAAGDLQAFRDKAISYAAYTYLLEHYPPQAGSGNATAIIALLEQTMTGLGYDINYYSIDYASGDPAALGIYIANQLDEWSFVDGSNEQNNYSNQIYDTSNMELNPNLTGNPGAIFPNQWQSMDLAICTDQAGNEIQCADNGSIPALSPEWGWVDPFSLSECQLTTFERAGTDWPIYLDPGEPPYLEDTNYLDDSILGPNMNLFKYGFVTTLMWHWFHNNPEAPSIDTSPNNIGNLNIVLNPTEPGEMGPADLPTTPADYANFYNLFTGQVPDPGYNTNPSTGLPYSPQVVAIGDYSQSIAQYWADGPMSETPPGHWFVILNQVSDSLQVKAWRGDMTKVLSDLEWDIKSYFTLGGGVHDAAIACWSAKGAYDYTRPIAAIRTMAEFGQCTDPSTANYHINGLPLIEGYIELVTQADIDSTLLNFEQADLSQVKVKTWLGPYGVPIANGWQGTQEDGHGWKLALDWWTYQVATFVTPPFAGYYSGHSTFSRTAAEILTQITGDPYFPGGMFEYVVDNFFADTTSTPTTPVHLQWATYRDASDQCSISRIFGGLHPPQDDIPGRRVGLIIGNQVVDFAESYMMANAPNVIASTVAETNPQAGDFDFSIQIGFDQAMNTAQIPTVQLNDPLLAEAVSWLQSQWINDSVLIASFEVPEFNGSLTDITFTVEGFQPATWVTTNTCTPDTLNFGGTETTTPLTIDLKSPICSVTAAQEILTDSDEGTQWQVLLTFDESMNPSSFDFAGALMNSDFTNNLSYQDVVWTADQMQATLQYTILDNNQELLLPVSALFNGSDLAGNALQGCELTASLAIDTYNPTATLGTPVPDAVVSDSEAITGSFSIEVFFDDTMDTTLTPLVSFSSDDPTVNTLTLLGVDWLNAFSCSVNFSVSDNNEELDNIVMALDGLLDSYGNEMAVPATFSQPFFVDTRNPIISEVNTTPSNITTFSTFNVAVTYDETMSETVAPNLTFPGSSIPFADITGGWSGQVYAVDYTINSYFTQSNIDLFIDANATDMAGNFSHDTTIVDAFDIDIVNAISEEGVTQEWFVYPNPTDASASIQVVSNHAVIDRLEVFDAMGKLIFDSGSVAAKRSSIDMPSWCSGHYHIQISSGDTRVVKPLLISSISR